MRAFLLLFYFSLAIIPKVEAFALLPPCFSIDRHFQESNDVILFGWFDNWQAPDFAAVSSRQVDYPEQYPATYEVNTIELEEDEDDHTKCLIRKLLKNTQLKSRPITLAYQASRDGWTAQDFHCCLDGKGASVVLATTKGNENPKLVGGYNPKGWASLGGARPSVAAFLFYSKSDSSWQKLQKVGGGGLALARDDPGYGISFGPDGLVIPFLDNGNSNRIAKSKLGPYYERGPEDLPSLFVGGITELKDIQVYVGVYGPDEDFPYSGGVLDMTSG
jgi:hypothetical protein